jgi:hypothetical protein
MPAVPSLADRLVPRVEFAVGGRRWPILFTHRVLLDCEVLTGIDMLATNLGNPSARLLRALLYLALERAGSSCTLDQVGALIASRGLRTIRQTVLEAWVASMAPSGSDSNKKAGKPESRKLAWLDAWAEATSRDGLGLTEDRWLDMTPRQTAALQKLRMDRMQREELLVGILASTTANYGYRRPKEPRTAESFMIHPLPEMPAEGLTGEYMMRQMKRGR